MKLRLLRRAEIYKGLVVMAIEWVKEGNYEDIIYSTYNGIAKITINRPEVHNAFRPKTVMKLNDAFAHARDNAIVGVIILTGERGRAFFSGDDQEVRGHGEQSLTRF